MLPGVLNLPDDGPLDIFDDCMRLLGTAVDHQPARTFRDPHPHHKYDETEKGNGKISEPPAEIRTDNGRIEQHNRAGRPDGRANPEAAVDHEISPSTIACRNQFLNGRIDRGVFTADPGAGKKSKQGVT